MKILLTGSSGQLGKAIQKKFPKNLTLITPKRDYLNLADETSCRNVIKEINPDLVLNCGAYTLVDKAEDNREYAFAINARAPKIFAEELSKTGGKLLQISTDFVFDGNQNFPYQTSQKRCATGVYGESKAKGEEYIEKILGGQQKAAIIRTSWLMGGASKNFAINMLYLHSTKKVINVVSDQIGCPTSPFELANACLRTIENWGNIYKRNLSNIPIFHWSDKGVASWYDVSVAIGELGEELKMINSSAIVNPIRSDDYPSKANRPKYSLLDCNSTREILKVETIHWRESLRNSFIESKKFIKNNFI